MGGRPPPVLALRASHNGKPRHKGAGELEGRRAAEDSQPATTHMNGKAREPNIPMLRLEIHGEPGEAPWRCEVGVQHLSGNVVSLKVGKSPGWGEWSELNQRPAVLEWKNPRGEVRQFTGQVVRVEGPESLQEGALLMLTLTEPPQIIKEFEAQVLTTPKDMKNLWEKWDQAHQGGWQTPSESRSGRYLMVAGAVLALSGAALLNWREALPPAAPFLLAAIGAVLAFLGWRRSRT